MYSLPLSTCNNSLLGPTTYRLKPFLAMAVVALLLPAAEPSLFRETFFTSKSALTGPPFAIASMNSLIFSNTKCFDRPMTENEIGEAKIKMNYIRFGNIVFY